VLENRDKPLWMWGFEPGWQTRIFFQNQPASNVIKHLPQDLDGVKGSRDWDARGNRFPVRAGMFFNFWLVFLKKLANQGSK
jgi:hypothetical protein